MSHQIIRVVMASVRMREWFNTKTLTKKLNNMFKAVLGNVNKNEAFWTVNE